MLLAQHHAGGRHGGGAKLLRWEVAALVREAREAEAAGLMRDIEVYEALRVRRARSCSCRSSYPAPAMTC